MLDQREKRKSHKLKHLSREAPWHPSPAPNLKHRQVQPEPLTPWHLIKDEPRFHKQLHSISNIRQWRRCLIRLLLKLGFLGDETARGLVGVVYMYIFSFPEPSSVSTAGRKTEPAAALSHAKASGLISLPYLASLYHPPSLLWPSGHRGGNLSQGCMRGTFPVREVPGVQVLSPDGPDCLGSTGGLAIHWASFTSPSQRCLHQHSPL